MLALIDALILNGFRSGVENSVLGLIRALADLAPGDVGFAARRALASAEPFLAAGRALLAPAWASGRLGRILAEQLWLPSAARAASVLHGPAYVLPLRWRGRAVVTIYDLIALRRPEWTKRANALHYGLMVPRSARRADAILVPSRAVADAVAALPGVSSDKIIVAPLGVRDLCRRVPPPAEVECLRAEFGLRRPYFAVVGNFEPKKNLRGVLRAFEEACPRLDHDLVIVGRPGWRCGADLAALRASPVADRVRLLGHLPDTDLCALYAGCTALLQWSLYEGFGLVPLEAMACGAAVIVSDGGALPEVAGPAAEVVPLGDPTALADAMVGLAGDDARRRAMSERGLQWSAGFTWRAHAARALDLYRALA
jgi:glycosyltransferase involved in cell wall biosynthesis